MTILAGITGMNTVHTAGLFGTFIAALLMRLPTPADGGQVAPTSTADADTAPSVAVEQMPSLEPAVPCQFAQLAADPEATECDSAAAFAVGILHIGQLAFARRCETPTRVTVCAAHLAAIVAEVTKDIVTAPPGRYLTCAVCGAHLHMPDDIVREVRKL